MRQPWLPSEVPEASRELVFQLGDAMASAMEKDYKEATQKFEALLQQYPQEANVHFRFGAFLNIQDSARGIEEIRKAVELAAGSRPGAGRADGDVPEAGRARIRRWSTASGRSKPVPEIFPRTLRLGRVLLAKENPGARRRNWKLRSSWRRPVPEARFSLASAYSRLGRKEDAARELAEFKRLENLEK